MPKDERRRQKALARKAARHNDKKRAIVRQAPSGGHTSLRAAAKWPLYEVLLSTSWQEPGELVQILVARSDGSEIAAAGFLVDLGLLGVKDALSHVLMPREYDEFRRTYSSLQPMKRADLDLVARIIQEGIAYAERFGFHPHPDFRDAALLLAGADPAARTEEIPLGMEGKPFFVPGPHDNAPRILRQLDRTVGPGNYHYILELGDLGIEDLPDTIEGESEEEVLPEQPPSFLPGLLRRRRPE